MTKILVLGGISETLQLVAGLSEKGFQVLVSQATHVPLEEPPPERVTFRHGVLDLTGLEKLAAAENISAIIDCTHPYASVISETVFKVSQKTKIPLLVYDRPGADPDIPGIVWADDHLHAAGLALSGEQRVFLSIGSSSISVYASRAGSKVYLLHARVLPGLQFLGTCIDAGLQARQVIQARGPFSVQENAKHFLMAQARVLVTKDSGRQGGVPAKLEAAEKLGLMVIMVRRPPRPGKLIFGSIDHLLEALPEVL